MVTSSRSTRTCLGSILRMGTRHVPISRQAPYRFRSVAAQMTSRNSNVRLWALIGGGCLSVGGLIGFALGRSSAPTNPMVELVRPPSNQMAPSPIDDASDPTSSSGVRLPVVPEALTETPDPNQKSISVNEVIELLGDSWLTRDQESGLHLTAATGDSLGGQPHGEWSVIWIDRGWTEVGDYVLGARHGTWKLYDENGGLLRESTYYGGRRNGPLRDRDGPDSPWRRYDYLNGELIQ